MFRHLPREIRAEGDGVGSRQQDVCDLADVAEGGGENLRGKIVELQIVGDLADEFRSGSVQIVDAVDVRREEARAMFRRENGLRRGVDGRRREGDAFLSEEWHRLEASQRDGHFHIEVA